MNGSQLSEPLGQNRGPGSAEAAEGRVCMVLAQWELVQPLRLKPVIGIRSPREWVSVGTQWKPLDTEEKESSMSSALCGRNNVEKVAQQIGGLQTDFSQCRRRMIQRF